MARPTPNGPLRGDELRRAEALLAPKELIAYRERRGGQAWNWIAARLGVSRTRVVHLYARAEQRLGYVQTVTPKQKAAYKPVAQRRAEEEARAEILLKRWEAELEPEEYESVLAVVEAYQTIDSPEELERLLRPRLEELARRRRATSDPTADDWSRAVGEAEAEFAAGLEADFGINEVTGEPMRPEDFVEDDGKGYDRF